MNEKFPEKLLKKLENLPRTPGVYRFFNAAGTVIYIGKARVLRSRVRSYFRDLGTGMSTAKTRVMAQKIRDIDYIVTDTEKEALILEANLVKEHKPRYNISLKDDKSFPYIKITNEDFPRIFSTRKKVNDGGAYFGPYTEARVMRMLLWTLRRIFPIRSCKYKLTPETIEKRRVRLCLDYHIKRCGGPCEGLVAQEEYGKMVSQIREFLQGHTKNLVRVLQENMAKSAAERAYESAALFRDRLREIESFQAKQKVVDMKPVDRGIAAVAVEDDLACGALFKEREGKIIGRRHHAIEGAGGSAAGEILQNFIMHVYLNEEYVPPEIFISHDVQDRRAISEWLTERRKAAVHIVKPQKGEKAKLTQMCVKNAELLLQELLLQELQKPDYVAYSVKELQKNLNLREPPVTIEAFDVSNVQGKDAVSSMVSFHNGSPQKSAYRVFKIRLKDTPDDFSMIAEAVGRRYSRLLKEGAGMPGLILVDGGRGQLSAALGALQKCGLDDIPVVGLAKRLDEVFVPGVPEPQNIPKTSAGLRLLQRVRDEAHRFALMHHRKQRKKRMLVSELDGIPGIGTERKRLLLKYFGSLAKLKEAAPASLAQVKTISESMAQTIYEYLHAQK